MFLFSASVAVSYLWGVYKRIHVDTGTVSGASEVSPSPTPTPDPLGPKNILILGYGGAGHDGGLLTDTMIVAHIKPRENTVTLVSIPRDILVSIPVKKDKNEDLKINHSYAIGIDHVNYPKKPEKYLNEAGGGILAKEKVTEVTGMNIDYFVSVNFDGFKNIINTLGGANVYVPYTFEDKFYPVKGLEDDLCGKSDEEIEAISATMSGELLEKEFACRYETIKHSRGLELMEGETALKFVRSRHSEIGGSDFGRAQRQQALLVAVKNKLLSYKSIPKIISIVNTLAKNVQTDVDLKNGFSLLDNYKELEDFEIKTVVLTTDNVLEEKVINRQYVLIPKSGQGNWESIKSFIKENLENK